MLKPSRPVKAPWIAWARKTLKVSFKQKGRLEASITHPSFRNENAPTSLENFDRLEFFGDVVLNFVICRKLYEMYPEANEGLLSRLRSILVSRKILCRIAQDIHIARVLRVGKSLSQQEHFSKSKIMADTLEALFAALYFDQGFPKTEKIILKYFEPYLSIKRLFRLDPNPKSTLQELSQKEWQKLPLYSHEPATDGVKTFVQIHRNLKAHAVGKTRKDSEEKAARLLIRLIRQELLRRSKKKSSFKKLRKAF